MTDELQVMPSELQPVPAGALEVIQRAEIDIQISTAHRYPRSMQVFVSRARSMALIDEETAASCIYSRPVGGGKFAEGLSVRSAEIVAASYGNIRVGATIIEQTDRYVKARGFAHDLEANYAVATEVIESTVKKDGQPYDERMRIVIAKSCLAKASRDATFKVVPKALFRAIELECRKLALGEGQSVSTRRARISQWITKLAIDPKRVWTALGVVGEADLTDEHFATLTGLKTAITDGEVQIDEAFPKIIAGGTVGANPLETATAKKEAAPAAPAEKVAEKAAPPVEAAPAEPVIEKKKVTPKAVTKVETPAEKAPEPKVEPETPAEPAKDPVPSATPNTDALRAELEEKCKAAGIDPSELVLYLAEQSFVPKGTTFKGLTGLHIQSVLTNWADVKDGVTGA